MDVRSGLSARPALRALPAAELDALAFAFVDRSHEDGAELIRLGQRARCMYLVLDGVISVTVTTGGIERELARLGPGALFGHMAVLDGAPASATCRALGRVRVGQLDGSALSVVLARDWAAARGLREAIGAQLAEDFRALMNRARRAPAALPPPGPVAAPRARPRRWRQLSAGLAVAAGLALAWYAGHPTAGATAAAPPRDHQAARLEPGGIGQCMIAPGE